MLDSLGNPSIWHPASFHRAQMLFVNEIIELDRLELTRQGVTPQPLSANKSEGYRGDSEGGGAPCHNKNL